MISTIQPAGPGSIVPSPNARTNIVWDVVRCHLREAIRAIERFEAALGRPDLTLKDLHRGPEERLVAHLDGLVAAGTPVVERVLLPGLESCPPGGIAVAEAIVLVLLMLRQYDAVWHALASRQSEVVHGALRAVGLKGDSGFEAQVLDELYRPEPKVSRALLLEVAAARRLSLPTLDPFLESTHASEVACALRATMWCLGAKYRKAIVSHLESPDPAVRRSAMLAGLHMGSGQAWSLCRQRGLDGSSPDPLAILLTGGLGGDDEHRALVQLLELESHRPYVLRALGYAGQIDHVERLLAYADGSGSRDSRLAVEAIATIAGLEPDMYLHSTPLTAPMAIAHATEQGLGPVPVRPYHDDHEWITATSGEDALPDGSPSELVARGPVGVHSGRALPLWAPSVAAHPSLCARQARAATSTRAGATSLHSHGREDSHRHDRLGVDSA